MRLIEADWVLFHSILRRNDQFGLVIGVWGNVHYVHQGDFFCTLFYVDIN